MGEGLALKIDAEWLQIQTWPNFQSGARSRFVSSKFSTWFLTLVFPGCGLHLLLAPPPPPPPPPPPLLPPLTPFLFSPTARSSSGMVLCINLLAALPSTSVASRMLPGFATLHGCEPPPPATRLPPPSSRLPPPSSLLPLPSSLFPHPSSLFPVPTSLLPLPTSLFPHPKT